MKVHLKGSVFNESIRRLGYVAGSGGVESRIVHMNAIGSGMSATVEGLLAQVDVMPECQVDKTGTISVQFELLRRIAKAVENEEEVILDKIDDTVCVVQVPRSKWRVRLQDSEVPSLLSKITPETGRKKTCREAGMF